MINRTFTAAALLLASTGMMSLAEAGAAGDAAREPDRNIEFASEGPPLVSCQTDDVTGTHLRKRTVCKSAEEDRENRGLLLQSQDQLRTRSSPQSEGGGAPQLGGVGRGGK